MFYTEIRIFTQSIPSVSRARRFPRTDFGVITVLSWGLVYLLQKHLVKGLFYWRHNFCFEFLLSYFFFHLLVFKENSATACSTLYLAGHWQCDDNYQTLSSRWEAISVCSHICFGHFRCSSDILLSIFFFSKHILSLHRGLNYKVCRQRQAVLYGLLWPPLTMKVSSVGPPAALMVQQTCQEH